MENFNLKKYLAENKLIKENENGSQHHIDEIDDDLMYGDFETEEEVDSFLDGIIAGIEEIRARYKEGMDDEESEYGRLRGEMESEEFKDEYQAKLDKLNSGGTGAGFDHSPHDL